jgi:hypothetical protein
MQIVAPEYHLEIEIDCKECELSSDDRLKLQEPLDRLGQSVAEFPKSTLWLTVVYHPRTKIYHAQAKLKWPGRTIIVGHKWQEIVPAVQLCLERVIRRVRYERFEIDQQAAGRVAAGLNTTVDASTPEVRRFQKLDDAVREQDYPAFRRFVSGYDDWVGDRIGRWIQRYPAAEHELGHSFEIGDVVEEVFLLAFDHHGDKPEEISFRDWLERWVDPALTMIWRSPEERENVETLRSGR